MVRAIILDCGGVMVAPRIGDWMLGPRYAEVLGESFMQTHLAAYRKARAGFVHLLPDANIVETDAEEHAMFIRYFRETLGAIGITLTPEQLDALAWTQTYEDDRYTMFDDVLPYLKKWQGAYKLGIVSDAPPSTRRIMGSFGVLDYIDGATFSCELGVLKPGRAIYESTLAKLDVAPGEAVFVDDMPDKLRGGEAVGIRGIQMRRQMPPAFNVSRPWDGPIVRSFAALDALLAQQA